MKQTLTLALARVFKRLHYSFDVMLMCVHWYVAYGLSVRNLKEMMAERGVEVDHSTVHRWAIKRVPQAHGKEVRGELTDRVQAA
jgi:putative transposase